MRRTAYNKRKRKNGCLGGLFRFVVLIAAIFIGANFLSKLYFDMDLSDKLKRTQYPIKYEYFVEKYSKEYGLDKNFVYAVIRTESRFDKMAVSSANAKGLMQLTDETGLDCAKKLGINDYKSSALFDPEINIRLGCYYLKYLIDFYDNTNIALAAYNGGMGNVKQWLSDKSNVDENGNLINIPFKETSNYVDRVNNAKTMYDSIYNK